MFSLRRLPAAAGRSRRAGALAVSTRIQQNSARMLSGWSNAAMDGPSMSASFSKFPFHNINGSVSKTFFSTDAEDKAKEEDSIEEGELIKEEEPTKEEVPTQKEPSEEIPSRSTILELLRFVQSPSEESVKKACGVFQEMIRQYTADIYHNNPTEKPDSALLEELLQALTQISSEGSGHSKQIAIQAQSIFDDLNNLYQTTDNSDFQPTLACYRDLILCWSRTYDVAKTEQIFLKQLLSPETLKQATEPYKPVRALLGQSLNHVLSAWAKSGEFNAGKRCDQLLSKLETPLSQKSIRVQANPESYHLANKAWRNAVETHFDKMYAKQFQHAAGRVRENVDYMMNRYKETQSPDWLPDPEWYQWLIVAYGYAGQPNEAQVILNACIQDGGKSLPTPPTHMYNGVLEACAHRGRGDDAGMLLSKWVSGCQMARDKAGGDVSATEGWEPDQTSCMLVIHAYGKLSDHYRAPRAEQILKRMWEVSSLEKEYLRVLPPPNTEVYNAVLKAWSNHRHYKLVQACTNAERILKEMHEDTDPHNQYDRFENPNPCWPNPQSYELVIETYARFGYNLADRRKRVNKLHRRMKHWSIPPTERCLEMIELCQHKGKSLDE